MLDSNQKKDRWDKAEIVIRGLGLLIPLASGFILGYFAHDYQIKQTEVYKLEVMEKFIPHIADSPKRRKVALVALDQLGYTKEALRFEGLYDDEETKSAITFIRAGAFKTKGTIEGASSVPKDNVNEKR